MPTEGKRRRKLRAGQKKVTCDEDAVSLCNCFDKAAAVINASRKVTTRKVRVNSFQEAGSNYGECVGKVHSLQPRVKQHSNSRLAKGHLHVVHVLFFELSTESVTLSQTPTPLIKPNVLPLTEDSTFNASEKK